MLTLDEWQLVLRAVAPRGKDWIILGLADAMPSLIARFAIDTTVRQAHFIGQVAHESDSFATTEEYASGQAYEGRKDLGNTQAGDGKRFKGRGLIQLTGRANYRDAGKALDVDLIADPGQVARFPLAATVSGWFWSTHDLNKHADRDDARMVTRIINGGFNGLEQRIAMTGAAKTALG